MRALCAAGFIDVAQACPYLGGDVVYAEEVVDAFVRFENSAKSDVFCFFDAEFYVLQLSEPLPPSANPLEHFLRFGIAHSLAPHPLISPNWMARIRPDLFSGGMALGSFVHALVNDWCDPSPFLWLTWYRSRARLLDGERALLHYIRLGASWNLAPNPYFDPKAYAAAVSGAPKRGLDLVRHFLTHGDGHLVATTDRFDPSWYVRRYPDAREADSGPLWYFLSVGQFAGHDARPQPGHDVQRSRATGPTADVAVEEAADRISERYERFNEEIAARQKARIAAYSGGTLRPFSVQDHSAALRGVAFAEHAHPDLDILIPCYNEFELTVECLLSLQQQESTWRFRVILADDASPDERFALLAEVPGIVVQRNVTNLHFLRSCNAAFRRSDAPFLLLLNNDTQVLAGAIDIMMAAMQSDARIGAVAPMFLYPNGRLQEAGCTVRSDGDSTMVGVGDDPDRACYGHARDIQYGSAAGLLVRRAAIGDSLFDERFVPAYCEDADLCLRLRAEGWRIRYEPAARIVHHLSVSTGRGSRRRRIQGVRRNQQKLSEKWSALLRAENRARVLAFYLPQFHPIPRNDVWWGKGFTEWSNVTRAVPSFEGHYQPHLPSDLGFYDLRRVETMGEQQALAERYGIEGFIVYYYNFGTARVLDQPMEALLARPDVHFRFALCWANENWTRHWDGGAKAMLLEQSYDAATLSAVAADMLRFAADARAIRVDGKPLMLIYRPLLVPDMPAVAAMLRQRFADAGHPGLHLVYVESMEAIGRGIRPADIGFDACVEFPPQGVAEPLAGQVATLKAGWEGKLYDYAGTAANAVLRPPAGYVRYPGVTPSWDNTARQPLKGTTLVGSEPELFQAYVEHKLEEMMSFTVGDERLLFVNAWNEWAEGAHLEPDRAYGHRWLTALRYALLKKGLAP